MRKPKMFGYLHFVWLLMAMLICRCNAEGNFEDTETSKDYASNTYPLFDLRQTIPGEPEVDYPIYSRVPRTSFDCTGRHEGYYADLETRCQVFRICANTALSVNGFAFLCPNGTLFSQKNFVCDWYRNVNCEESEQYYSKNNVNRIGSSSDMMARVRHMMEYPMKTISKTLLGNMVSSGAQTAASSTTTHISHQTLKKELEKAESGLAVSELGAAASSTSSSHRGYYNQRQSVHTRTEFGTSWKGYEEEQKPTKLLTNTLTQQQQQQQEEQQKQQQQGQRAQQQERAEAENNNFAAPQTYFSHNDIYVNSLGELSTDPGVEFVRDQAHIIAKPAQQEIASSSNIAGSASSFDENYKISSSKNSNSDSNNNNKNINNNSNNDVGDTNSSEIIAGLQNNAEPPTDKVVDPEYTKIFNRLQSRDELLLASNINNLLEEVSSDVRFGKSLAHRQVPALPTNATAFKYLSRGFAKQNELDGKQARAYEYVKPKQTGSTIRFTGNELSADGIPKAHKEFLVETTSSENYTNSTQESADVFKKPTNTINTTTPSTAKSVADIARALVESGRGFTKAPEIAVRADIRATTQLTPTSTETSNENTKQLDLDTNLQDLPTESFDTTTISGPILFEFKNFKGENKTDNEDTKLIEENNTESNFSDTTTQSPLSILLKEKLNNTIEAIENIKPPAKLLQPPVKDEPAQNLEISSALPAHPTIVAEDKLDVDKHAAKLLLAGVKLTTHQNFYSSLNVFENQTLGDTEPLLIHVEETKRSELNHANINVTEKPTAQPVSSTAKTTTESSEIATTPSISSTAKTKTESSEIATTPSTSSTTKITTTATTTIQPETSTSVIASISESNSHQERRRSYRRFSSSSSSTSNAQLSNVKRKIEKTTTVKPRSTITTTSTTTPKPTSTPTSDSSTSTARAYLKRIPASRLLLARQTAKNNRTTPTTTAATISDAVDASTEGSKKVSARDIDKEVGSAGNGGNVIGADSTKKRRNMSRDRGNEESNKVSTTSGGSSNRNHTRNSLRRFQVNRKTSITTTIQRGTVRATPNRAVRRRNRTSNIRYSTTTSATGRATTTETTKTATTTTAPPTKHTEQIPNLEHEFKSSASTSTVVSINAADATNSSAIKTTQTDTENVSSLSINSNATLESTSSPFTSSILDSTSTFPPSSTFSPSTSLSDAPENTAPFIDFTKLTRAIVDDSVLQNFRSQPPFERYQSGATASSRSLSLSNYVSDATSSSFSQTSQEFNKLRPQAPTHLTPPPRPSHLPQVSTSQQPTSPTSPAPRIVIAPAEGKRITPGSVASIVSSLVTEPTPKTTPSTSYVPLDDFLTKKFGKSATPTNAINYNNQQSQPYSLSFVQRQQFYQKPQASVVQEQQSQENQQQLEQQRQSQYTQYKNQQLEQLQQYQQQQPQQQQEKHQFAQQQNQQFAQQQYYNQQFSHLTSPNRIYSTPAPQQQARPVFTHTLFPQQQQQQQQQKQQQKVFAQQSLTLHNSQQQPKYQQSINSFYFPKITQQSTQQSLQQQQRSSLTPNFFNSFKQQQKHLPQFPPLGTSDTPTFLSNPPFNEISNTIAQPEHDVHLNIKLPALTGGLIPAPTLNAAQRRSDNVDTADDEVSKSQQRQTTNTGSGSYNGVSSYDVPLSSIGRLPNDITHLLNRRLRRFK